MDGQEQKDKRILSMFSRLQKGEVLYKSEEAARFKVTEKSIQRDIDLIREYFADMDDSQTIVYDKLVAGYRLADKEHSLLSNGELLAVCKILLESRSMPRADMMNILDKLVNCCASQSNKKLLNDLIGNERLHYIEPHHGVSVLDRLWEIGTAIREQRVMRICYSKLKNKETIQRTIEPVGLMFSEYYFYLTAFLRDVDRKKDFHNPDDLNPTIYRIDRIQDYTITDEHFKVQYAGRFEEGEFRKRVQFMLGGELQTVRFRYTGLSIEAVLDRLPTATVEKNPAGGWDVEAEVFGKGIDMWLNSQAPFVQSKCYSKLSS